MTTLEELGQLLKSCILTTMETGYDHPLRRTGALEQDLTYECSGSTVTVGNTLEYGKYVHSKYPYIADGIAQAEDSGEIQRIICRRKLEEIAHEYNL